MKLPNVITVDFETHPIEARPAYPPVPVGVGIWEPRRKPVYLAWGHATGNNCTEAEGKRAVRRIWSRHKLFHNAAFDVDVAETWAGVTTDWLKVHDTTWLAFFNNPFSNALSLKPLAEELLGMEPDERDELRDWLMKHVPGAKKGKKAWALHISKAPGGLAGRYCVADLRMTRGLFEYLWPLVMNAGMAGAYQREQLVGQLLLAMERQGFPVDVPKMNELVPQLEAGLETVDKWIRRRLKAPTLEVMTGDALADACENAGIVDEWVMTAATTTAPDGNRSTKIASLRTLVKEGKFHDHQLVEVLSYRAQLQHGLTHVLRPWLRLQVDGRVCPRWNSVRGDRDDQGRQLGAKTGRVSSNPNAQNIPRVPRELAFTNRRRDPDEEKILLPKALEGKVPPLPNLRDLVCAGPGKILIDGDFAQQELRVLAHYEGGELVKKYLENPDLDFHQTVTDMLNEQLGTNYKRTPIKTVNFGILYGEGLEKLADSLETSIVEASTIKRGVRSVLRGVANVEKWLKSLEKSGEKFDTWGGRRYGVEPPKMVHGQIRHFGYKMLNHLIQGSSGDQIKEALILVYQATGIVPVLTVHDEIVLEVPVKRAELCRELMKGAMEAIGPDYKIPFKVPMRTDFKVGLRWGSAEKVK